MSEFALEMADVGLNSHADLEDIDVTIYDMSVGFWSVLDCMRGLNGDILVLFWFLK